MKKILPLALILFFLAWSSAWSIETEPMVGDGSANFYHDSYGHMWIGGAKGLKPGHSYMVRLNSDTGQSFGNNTNGIFGTFEAYGKTGIDIGLIQANNTGELFQVRLPKCIFPKALIMDLSLAPIEVFNMDENYKTPGPAPGRYEDIYVTLEDVGSHYRFEMLPGTIGSPSIFNPVTILKSKPFNLIIK